MKAATKLKFDVFNSLYTTQPQTGCSFTPNFHYRLHTTNQLQSHTSRHIYATPHYTKLSHDTLLCNMLHHSTSARHTTPQHLTTPLHHTRTLKLHRHYSSHHQHTTLYFLTPDQIPCLHCSRRRRYSC